MPLVPRDIHTDPEPLVEVFERCITHKKIDYHKSLSHGEKTDKKRIGKWAKLLHLMYLIAPNLAFRKTCVEEALYAAVPKLQQLWEKPLEERHIPGWVKAAAKRICNMCRHTAQVMVKGKEGKPTWAHKMFEAKLPKIAKRPAAADDTAEEEAEEEAEE